MTKELIGELRNGANMVAPIGSKSGEARWYAAEKMREAADALERQAEAVAAITEANNSLYGSQSFFLSTNGGPADRYHLARPIEDLKERARKAERQAEVAAKLVEALQKSAEGWENVVETRPMDADTPKLVVTQADRDAAAARLDPSLTWSTGAMLREGRMDSHAWVQAFARHRIASEQAAARRALEMEKAIKMALLCTPSVRQGYDGMWIEYDCGDPWEILRAAINPSEGTEP